MTHAANEHTPAETVTRFFHLIATGEWTTARELLTDLVDIAHGAHHETLPADELISGWKQTHARYHTTRYELTPPTITFTSRDRATARCDSHATFCLDTDTEEPTMTIDGHYTLHLEHTYGTWRIRSMHHDET